MILGSNPVWRKTCSSFSSIRPYLLCDPPSLLSNGYRSSFAGISGRGVKLTTYLHLMLRLRMSGAIPLLPLCVFKAWTGTTLPFDLYWQNIVMMITQKGGWLLIWIYSYTCYCVLVWQLTGKTKTVDTTNTLLFFNPLNPELNPICYLLALLAHHFLHVSRIMVKSLTLRFIMSYIYIYIYIWSAYSWCF